MPFIPLCILFNFYVRCVRYTSSGTIYVRRCSLLQLFKFNVCRFVQLGWTLFLICVLLLNRNTFPL